MKSEIPDGSPKPRRPEAELSLPKRETLSPRATLAVLGTMVVIFGGLAISMVNHDWGSQRKSDDRDPKGKQAGGKGTTSPSGGGKKSPELPNDYPGQAGSKIASVKVLMKHEEWDLGFDGKGNKAHSQFLGHSYFLLVECKDVPNAEIDAHVQNALARHAAELIHQQMKDRVEVRSTEKVNDHGDERRRQSIARTMGFRDRPINKNEHFWTVWIKHAAK